MRIIFVCHEYPPRPHGGIGTFTQTTARGLAAAGHPVQVVGLGPADERADDQGVAVVTLRHRRGGPLGWLVNRLHLHRWLAAEVRDGRADIVEVPDYEGWLPFGFSACPVVVRLHLSETVILGQKGQRPPAALAWCERRTLARHPLWVGVSAYSIALAEQAFHLRARQQTVIFCPVNLPAPGDINGLDLPRPYILFPGTASRRKGALALAEACRLVLPDHPQVHLVFAGSVPTEEEGPNDQAIRRRLGPDLAGRVRFLGRVSHAQMVACMAESLLVAFPSSLETFGLVVAEAMACAKAVIYATVPPGPEVVNDGQDGLLADPARPADIAAKLRRLLDDPELRQSLGAAARESARSRFSTQACVQASLDFYRKARAG
ncbi:MAG: glycosyltransferase family 4 protein [Pseudomonadota bacterium]